MKDRKRYNFTNGLGFFNVWFFAPCNRIKIYHIEVSLLCIMCLWCFRWRFVRNRSKTSNTFQCFSGLISFKRKLFALFYTLKYINVIIFSFPRLFLPFFLGQRKTKLTEWNFERANTKKRNNLKNYYFSLSLLSMPKSCHTVIQANGSKSGYEHFVLS